MTRQRLAQLPIPPFSRDIGDGGDAQTWLQPIGITAYNPLDEAQMPLAGGPYGFSAFDVINAIGDAITVTRMAAGDVIAEATKGGDDAESRARRFLHRLTRPRKPYAGLAMDHWYVMGIINTTPDSFSDGGDHFAAETALQSARAMTEAGAAILDIGGESTRPGAEPVGFDEECRRILPVIKTLSQEGHLISADTRHSPVMDQALDHGAEIINDVGGLRAEGAIALLAKRQAPAMIMHMQGEPGTMQKNPRYRDAPTDIFDWLEERINTAVVAGIPRGMLAIDPGFGFGKTPQHNMEILQSMGLYHGLCVPIVLGVSRKSTIGHFSKGEAAKDRMAGSVALAALARMQGVQIFRVHDVEETMQALLNVEAQAMAFAGGVSPKD